MVSTLADRFGGFSVRRSRVSHSTGDEKLSLPGSTNFRQRLGGDALSELETLDGEWAAVMALLDRQMVFSIAAFAIPERLGVDFAFGAEWVDDLDAVRVRAVSGNRSDVFLDLTVPAGMGIAGKVAVLRHPITVEDYFRDGEITHDFDPQWQEEGLCSTLAVPIIRGHRCYGVLCAATRQRRAFSEESLKAMVQIARQLALTIEVADRAQDMVEVAVHEERQRLALSLHDSVGAMLFSIGAAVRDLGSQKEFSPTLADRLTYLEKQVATTTAQLRSALQVLHEVPKDVNLGVTLRSECRALEHRSGIGTHCVVFDGLPRIPEEHAQVLVLTVREALLNAEKHSKARTVIVSLQAGDDGGVNLVVADDGVGVPTGFLGSSDNGHGLGLEATVERIGQLGGRVEFLNNEDEGFTLRVWVPC